MREINEKLSNILLIIKEIGKFDEGVENILMDGFSLSLRTIQQVIAKKDRDEIDIDTRIDLVTKALGFPIEDLVNALLAKRQNELMQQSNNGMPVGLTNGKFDPNKIADEETLSFILNSSNIEDNLTKVLDNDARQQSSEEITSAINAATSEEAINNKNEEIDDYQKFLNEAKQNLNFLKTQI